MSVATGLDAVMTVVALLLLVPTAVLFIQVMAARRPLGPTARPPQRRPTVAVLMPAHDESAGIAAAIRSVLPQLRAQDRFLVVADNCNDDTAALAAALDARVEVIERSDATLRGKGYALDHGVRHLEADPREVVVVVDADCEVHPGSLDRLARECSSVDRAVQALYLMRSPPGAGAKTRIGEFAFALRNHVRPLGCQRLGWPCQLMGTGMAFPWARLAAASLASGHIVEDMQLGLDLAAAGAPPLFCNDALVTSVFPQSEAGRAAQRTRWEHGHLATIASRVPRLLVAAIVKPQPALAAMALDLSVPPLASLVLMWTATAACATLLAAIGGSLVTLGVSGLGVALMVAAIGTAWWRFARQIVSVREWLSVPGYVVAKIPMYVRVFTARQKEWVRSKRNADS